MNKTLDGTYCSLTSDCQNDASCRTHNCYRYTFNGYSNCRDPPVNWLDITGCPAFSQYIEDDSIDYPAINCYYWCPKKLRGTPDSSDNPAQSAEWLDKCNVGAQTKAVYECYDWVGGCKNITGGTTCENKGSCSSTDCLGKPSAMAFDCVGGSCMYGVPSGDTVECVLHASADGKCKSIGHAGTTNHIIVFCWDICVDPCAGVTCPAYCSGNTAYTGGHCVGGHCVYTSNDCGSSGCVGMGTYRNNYCTGGSCAYTDFPCDPRCDHGNPTATITGAPADWQYEDANGAVSCTDPEGCCNAIYYRIYSAEPTSCPPGGAGYTPGNTFTIDNYAWVCAYVEDNSGNPGISAPEEFKVDKIKPNITCSNCYLPSPVIGGTDITFSPLVNDTYSGIQRVRICADADCATLIYCQNNVYAPGGTPVVRECSYPTEDCIYSENEFYVEATDLVGNMEVIKGGTFTTILRDGCECDNSENCETGKCIAGQCLMPVNPNVSFTSNTLTAELGSRTQAVISVKNNIAVGDTIKIRLYATPEKILYWTKFTNNEQEIDISLNPYEEKLIPLEIFAGEIGTYKLTIFAESTLISALYARDEQTIQIVHKNQGFTSRTPGLNILQVIIIILIAACISTSERIS